jgi:alkanesulfonate monooxygenase SsuD/methylene tetrahydromethanopterin reductase-like flavin-dependent oxidoreductase (luciferase family)
MDKDAFAGAVGFGVAGALDHGIVAELAAAAEAAGYATFWANDVPGGEGLAALAAAAAATERIGLGVGVAPLDRQPPAALAARIAELGLPTERLVVGVGAGMPAGGLERVRDGVAELRAMTPARIAVGALGPRMCDLAGEVADAVLLNWLTPEHAAESAALALAAAAAADRPRPRVVGYVRTAVSEGMPRLVEEANRYASYPAYAANFARMGVAALETTVHGPDRAALRAGLAPYQATLDETVVRCIAPDDVKAYQRVLTAARP